MYFIEFENSQKETYTNFVISNEGSFLQAWEWGDWQKSLDSRKIFRFGIYSDAKELIMVVQMAQTFLIKHKYYLYAPYGPVPCKNSVLENTALELLVGEIKKRFPEAVFLRLEPTQSLAGLEELGKKAINIQPGGTLQLDISQPMEELLKQMHPKTRYNIKVAQKHGVEIKKESHVFHGKNFSKEALELIIETAQRQQYYTHRLSYYEKLFDFFVSDSGSNNIELIIYKALYNSVLLASAVMVDFGTTRTYLFGGSSNVYRNFMAPYGMHFEAIRDAQEKHLSVYDFDGLEASVGKQAGFARFKEGFGGNKILFAGAYDIIFSPVWYTTYTKVRSVNRALKQLETKIKSWL